MLLVSYSDHGDSDTLANYWPLFERLSRRYVHARGAEIDDLVQESAIAGWFAIQDGFLPSSLVVNRACMRYVRSLNVGGWRLGMGG